jgi:hypothetical protein
MCCLPALPALPVNRVQLLLCAGRFGSNALDHNKLAMLVD